MDVSFLKDKKSSYVISVFVNESEVTPAAKYLEPFSNFPWVHISLQPCPFEGIEFLYRAPIELPTQRISMDRTVYWHALELKADVSEAELKKVAAHHHEFLIAILEQDSETVLQKQQQISECL